MRFKLKKRAAYKYSTHAHSQPLTRAALFMIALVYELPTTLEVGVS